MDVAGNVNVSPEQIAGTCVKVGFTGAVTVMTIALLVTVKGEAQAALLVMTQTTLFALARIALVYDGLFDPTFVPLTFH